MFFKQVWRNAAKNRKGNGLFFGSLIIAIIAFYTLLSLEKQDVIQFLATIESDAVRKLLALLPIVYMLSLFFVFFLVYFACKYQTDNRRREFGMYLMLGMKRSRLFFMLFCETLWNSLVSLLIGLPAALFLTEGISLATAKLVGLGIIGHRFSFSMGAMVWTVCGFAAVQLVSMLIICVPFGRTEPAQFLRSDAARNQAEISKAKSTVFFAVGAILLLGAYALGVFGLKSLESAAVLALLIFGVSGTFFLYRGLGGFLGKKIQKKRAAAAGLTIFNARQVQENVIAQHKSLAVASLLLLMALSCVSYGISMGLGRAGASRSADFSLFGEEREIDAALEGDGIRELVKSDYPMYLSLIKNEYFASGENELDLSEFRRVLGGIKGSENIIENLHAEYVIAESSYNALLRSMGKEEIRLGEKEIALYTSMSGEGDFGAILEKAIQKGVSVGIDGTDYTILPDLCYDNIVADRAITLYTALIVPEDVYFGIAREDGPYCRNIRLADAITKELGLMKAIQTMDGKLAGTGLRYDSFLTGIGRNLFYSVAASYLTVYLGILFLLIANTVIGLKYLIQQRQNKHRYRTLFMLGADTEELCRSVKKQIRTFFALVLSVAVASSLAAIVSMFLNLTKLPVGTPLSSVLFLAGIALLGFILTEMIYIGVVKRTACREIGALERTDREE